MKGLCALISFIDTALFIRTSPPEQTSRGTERRVKPTETMGGEQRTGNKTIHVVSTDL